MLSIVVVGLFGLSFTSYASDQTLENARKKELVEKFNTATDLFELTLGVADSSRIEELRSAACAYAECCDDKERRRLLATVSFFEVSKNYLLSSEKDLKDVPLMIQKLEEMLVHETPEDRVATQRMIQELEDQLAKK